MNKLLTSPTPRLLRLQILVAGAVGFVLRLLVTTTGIDDKGLLRPGRIDWILLVLLSIVTGLHLLAQSFRLRGPSAYRRCFPASPVTAAGCVLGAVGAVAAAVSGLQTVSIITRPFNLVASAAGLLRGALLVLAPIAFVLVAWCRLKERRPNFLLHAVICVAFALHTLSLYQSWSFDPQLHHYCFQLLASICLTITAYQLACFDTGKGSHRSLWFWGLASVFLCCVSAASGMFFLAGAVWAWTSLTNLRRPRRPAVQIQETETSTEV